MSNRMKEIKDNFSNREEGAGKLLKKSIDKDVVIKSDRDDKEINRLVERCSAEDPVIIETANKVMHAILELIQSSSEQMKKTLDPETRKEEAQASNANANALKAITESIGNVQQIKAKEERKEIEVRKKTASMMLKEDEVRKSRMELERNQIDAELNVHSGQSNDLMDIDSIAEASDKNLFNDATDEVLESQGDEDED